MSVGAPDLVRRLFFFAYPWYSSFAVAAFGLANRVLDDEAFDDEVDVFVRQFERVSGPAVSLSKRLFYEGDAMSFKDALERSVDINVNQEVDLDPPSRCRRFFTIGAAAAKSKRAPEPERH
ncbi:MAG TPA: hypothetical protein VEM96_08570 [Pyrinomonadaceae bacterium]|nr:hypothetical protein [Pyrinomonadaceae bacterium]